MKVRGSQPYDVLPEAVIVLDADRRVVGVNDRARRLLDLDGPVAGQPLAAVMQTVDASGADCTASLTRPRGVAARLAERMVDVVLADGRQRPVAIAGRHGDDGGLVLTLRSAARRERLDTARSDLIATVAHEIRSPLTSVKGFARTLLDRWEHFDDEQKRTMLATIDHDADRVTRLLTELLDVSRIDAGRVQLHRAPIQVEQVARGVVERARVRPADAERRIDVRATPDLPRVHADADKIEQVLLNLVDNALLYADPSPITIEVDTEGADGVHLRVADQGPGIPADEHHRIFEKFGRGRRQRGSGSGLGLYISRGLVRAHGGEIWVESADDAGATFHVVLPRRADVL